MNNHWRILLIVLALIGVLDAGYLTYEHFQNIIPPCSVNSFFGDCGKVLRSEYAVPFGMPLSLIGLIHYSLLTSIIYLGVMRNNQRARIAAILLTTFGFVSSLYFMYLQLFILYAICLFCTVSAITSGLLFILVLITCKAERKLLFVRFFGLIYRYGIKFFLFKLSPEFIHNRATHTGQLLGKSSLAKATIASVLTYQAPLLKQHIAGIDFQNPIGLSAGFDYEGRLTQLLPPLGFGLGTIGTITHLPYGGNPRPLLGRLPKSKSLMVNKGFKNLGAAATIRNLSGLPFTIPIGISIGRTNTRMLTTQKQSITDIIQTFVAFEQSSLEHTYYELNISCPNLYGDVTFYLTKNLHELLAQIDKLKLKRPLFVKMPTEKSNTDVLQMLAIIAQHSPNGVIFGNLQKDRNNPVLHASEVRKFSHGNFSGKPAYERSNELIHFAYKYYSYRFIIIGSGGVFSAEDAYTKITLGASLVQLITGMIFQGPQLIAEINMKLPELLKKDGFTNISQAVGTKKM